MTAVQRDPASWTGADLARRTDWVLAIGDAVVDELDAWAAELVPRLDGDPSRLLHLPEEGLALGPATTALVADLRQRLAAGLGFAVVRGLPIDRFNRLELAAIYWALGSALGRPLANNPAGDMLGHVTDLGKDLDHPLHRAYQTNVNMFFHVDQCDVVGLLCIRPAKEGGRSKVASSIHAHDVLWERAPRLADALTRSFRWSRMGEVGPDEDEWYPAPVFASVEGRVSVSGGVKHIEKGHQLPGSAPLEPEALDALHALNDICEEIHLAMDFEPGDMQFLNNAVCMHSRTGYEDWPDPEERRLLWRLWLNVDGLRPRSPFFRNWESGIWAPADRRNITLEPPR